MALFSNNTEVETTKKESASEGASLKSASSQLNPSLRAVLIQPRISEKSAKHSELGKYIFVIAKTSNKIQVKKAVEQYYKVHVTQVNIVNTRGKVKNSRGMVGQTSGFKKAIVTLKAGEKIETAETV